MNEAMERGAGARKVDIKTQLIATHNSVFPFSSPNLDSVSLKSGQSGHTFQSQNPFESDLSTPPLDVDRGSMSDRDEFHLERYSQHIKQQRLAKEEIAARKNDTGKKSRPDLRIVTDSFGGQSRAGNLVLNQVAAKQPKQGKNRALSVVSQRAVQGLPSPYYQQDSVQAFSELRDLVASKRVKKRGTKSVSKQSKVSSSTTKPYSPARSSVIFGLSVPKHLVALHQQGNELQSAVTLITPATPKVLASPTGNNNASSYTKNTGRHQNFTRKISPTSIYTDESPGSDQSDNVKTGALSPQRSYHVRPNEFKEPRRLSSDSQREFLVDSSDTARPKSQGWWNLMLSPMLSRAGTLKVQKVLRSESIPPVPPIPADLEKDVLIQTPITYMSPVTPRRVGLAGVQRSRDSSWTQWDDEETLDELNDRNLEEVYPTLPREHLSQGAATEVNLVMADHSKHEGLAAEYFHACAIEQLSNVTYFECVNHSCNERLPKLCSVYDSNHHKTGFIPLVLTDKGLEALEVTNSPSAKHKAMSSNDSARSSHKRHAKNGATTLVTFSADESSPVTPIDSEIDIEEFVSPNVRHANTAAFSKPKEIQPKETPPLAPPVRAESSAKKLNIKPASSTHQEAVQSPGPVSPEATRTIAPIGAVQMAPVQSLPANRIISRDAPISHADIAPPNPYQPPQTIVYYPYAQPTQYPFYAQNLPPHPAIHHYAPNAGIQSEQTEGFVVPILYPEPGKQNGGNIGDSQHIKQEPIKDTKERKKKPKFFGLLCCFRRVKGKEPKKRRQYIGLGIILVIVIIACILFAIFFSRGSRDVNPVVSQWLNLTGYPPVPTGISTIVSPNLATSQNQCIRPTTLWSCALTKEEQAILVPNAPDQPNFRFQIRFRNGTVPANMTFPLSRRSSDPGADDPIVSTPSPPGQLDQIFMGSTTDNVTLPFEGEATPFFITFLSPAPGQSSSSNLTTKLASRQSTNGDFSDLIPAPSIGPDGTAAPASLLPTTPLPISQPLRLYNRGLRDEHYGFYVYYDKSIFLSGISLRSNTTSNNILTSTDVDQNGGSTKSTANVRCTWSQTRFLVKMYTNPTFNARLLSPLFPTSTNTTTNSATQPNVDRPGSFPYPTTILLDRHGGDPNRKFVYCYGMNPSDTKIVTKDKRLVFETRAFGGVLMNPSPGPVSLNLTGPGFDSNVGGIDGGTGGCGCEWRNWN